jgi:hypothetical protein
MVDAGCASQVSTFPLSISTRRSPLVGPGVIAITYLALFRACSSRSSSPARAVVPRIFSVAAAYGVLGLVFQWGSAPVPPRRSSGGRYVEVGSRSSSSPRFFGCRWTRGLPRHAHAREVRMGEGDNDRAVELGRRSGRDRSVGPCGGGAGIMGRLRRWRRRLSVRAGSAGAGNNSGSDWSAAGAPSMLRSFSNIPDPVASRAVGPEPPELVAPAGARRVT